MIVSSTLHIKLEQKLVLKCNNADESETDIFKST